ncbi:chromosome segregation protein SMC [Miniphocaeibacter massiliensis]|uniref:chromosome segregation protein SMC n=1 Tax=Miniphocaeibacter massiliensis TaxID=2041841 RepID=UPI0013EA542F|nr:chromosome segregation protein SMC [Miniphocaeibacter massiliensis]
MKLQSIEIQGFKSFRDKIKLQFNNPICAIVGPNGSGKSNISDAIRWVLGEQSAKSLRGTKMEDVIFSGTAKSKPLNFAQVSLNFDNSDKWIPVEFSEVNITRRVFRTGESEYYINKRACRLKDIRELFLDTGIGKEGYSIIGQGRIDEILSSKSEDRRYIFEEASGISKFKYKKEESLKKLEKTISNLARIEDILIQKIEQRDFLENQAKKAKEGITLINEIKFLDIYFNKMDLEKLGIKISNILEENISLKSDIEKNKKEINEIEPKLEELLEKSKFVKLEYEELENKLNLIEKEKNDFNLNVKLNEEKLEYEKTEINRLIEEKTYIQNKIKDLENKIKENENSKKDTNKTIEDIKNSILEYTKEKDLLTNVLEDKKTLANKINDKIIELTNLINELEVDKRTREGIEKSEIEKLQQNKEKSSKLNNELKNLNLELNKLNSEKELIFEKEEYISKEIIETKESINKIDEQLKKLQADKNILISKDNDLNREYSFYKNVKENYEGFNKQVSNFFKSIKRTNLNNLPLGTLVDLISVDDKYAKAINNVLSGTLQNIVVKNENDAKKLIEFLKAEKIGRLTFLPITKIKGNNKNGDIKNPNIIAVASEVIETKEEYRGLIDYFLSRTLIVENIENAIAVSKIFKQFRVVTLDGDVFNSWGSIVGGFNKFKKDSNIINRSKNINNLIIQIKNNRENIKNIEEKIVKSSIEIKNYNVTLENKLNLNKDINIKIEELNDNIKEIETLILIKENSLDELEVLIKEINEKYNYQSNEENIDNLKNELSKSNKEYNLAINEISEINTKINYIEYELVKYNSEKESLDRDLNIKENFYIENLNELNDLRQRYKNNENQLVYIDKSLEDRNNNISKYNEKLFDVNRDFENLIKIIPSKKKEYENITNTYSEQKDLVNDMKNILTKLEYNYDFNLNKLEGVSKDKDKIVDFMKEEYNINIENITLLDETTTKTRSELKVLKNKLKNLGYFSVDSIEEYEIVNDEVNFLSNQKDDLLKSKDDIESIIKTLDKDMKKMFIFSFNDINERFNKIFSVLFDGGYANLELEDNDVLTSGIDIVAQPPGKKLQNLSLLSGGERSLTAVALLFAIFETRPSPFCILDEIDAALDEANIFRYTKYLKSFTDTAQFIMISHRKSTMEIADILYGVSMEEEGVSKVISLELE